MGSQSHGFIHEELPSHIFPGPSLISLELDLPPTRLQELVSRSQLLLPITAVDLASVPGCSGMWEDLEKAFQVVQSRLLSSVAAPRGLYPSRDGGSVL